MAIGRYGDSALGLGKGGRYEEMRYSYIAMGRCMYMAKTDEELKLLERQLEAWYNTRKNELENRLKLFYEIPCYCEEDVDEKAMKIRAILSRLEALEEVYQNRPTKN